MDECRYSQYPKNECLMKIIYINILISSHAEFAKRRLVECKKFAEFRIVQKTILKDKPGVILTQLVLICHVDATFVIDTLQNFFRSIYEPESVISFVHEYET